MEKEGQQMILSIQNVLKTLNEKIEELDSINNQACFIIRLNKRTVDNYEITDNIKYIVDCIPELITFDFKIQLKNTIQQNNDYSKYFIKTLKLNK